MSIIFLNRKNLLGGSKKKNKTNTNKTNKNNKSIYKNNTNKADKFQDYSEEVRECNKILRTQEHKCNCFLDGNVPDSNISDCMKKNNGTECKNYNICKKKFMEYMSGTEPNFDPNKWNHPYIKGSHNCYTYFLNDKIKAVSNECRRLCKKKHKGKCPKKTKKCRELKPQPGDYANLKGWINKNRKYTCSNMEKKIYSDNLEEISRSNTKDKKEGKGIVKNKKSMLFKVPFTEKCPPNYYKGEMTIDDGHTYHFYRQDNNGRFSHKPGTLGVEHHDASGFPIYAPHLSDRNYNKEKRQNGINYNKHCGYYCIPNNHHKDTHAI